jgi:ATP-dependent Clp protease ATP-binding subunit ClpC
MFERFTDQARQVVTLARAEARALDHGYIGTEHILLGLIREGESIAASALESLGISLQAVRAQVEEITGRGEKPVSAKVPFTPRAKKVLELSLREALQLGHNYIGPEHILLGLIREGEGAATRVLVRLGAELRQVRNQVHHLLREKTEEAGPPEQSGPRARIAARARVSARAASGAFPAAEPSLFDMLTSIGERLTAIEQRLGIPGTGQQEGGEVARLQALLRQHGINPGGDPGDESDPAAAD